MKKRRNLLNTVFAASAALLTTAGGSAALAQQCAAENESAPTLSPRIGQKVQELYELAVAERYQEALAGYDELIAQRGANMTPYEKSTVYELRGSIKANSDDFPGALRDFQVALNTNGLPVSRNNQLRYFIAQLNFQQENYGEAIRGLNAWIQNSRACGETVDANAYYLLAAAYIQFQPPNYRAAQDPAERAVNSAPTPRKGSYDLLNLVYSELGENAKRGALLEQMVNYWPGEKSYWVQLSGLYSTTGKDKEAFSVLEVAYRAGLLDKESELITLINYYSYFDNPYRGATMLVKEMDAGNIERDQDNLILLSQLWSQSREHKKSIPILREAARNASNGELSYRLGQVLLADEQYAASQRALETALNKGGMDRKDTGDAWLLLGTARFNQAGPEDTAIWRSARQAFVNAQRYETARGQATSWIAYIDAVINTYRQQKDEEARLAKLQCEDELKRLEQQQRIRELQNRQPTPEETANENAIRTRCEAIINGGEVANEPATDTAEGETTE